MVFVSESTPMSANETVGWGPAPPMTNILAWHTEPLLRIISMAASVKPNAGGGELMVGQGPTLHAIRDFPEIAVGVAQVDGEDGAFGAGTLDGALLDPDITGR